MSRIYIWLISVNERVAVGVWGTHNSIWQVPAQRKELKQTKQEQSTFKKNQTAWTINVSRDRSCMWANHPQDIYFLSLKLGIALEQVDSFKAGKIFKGTHYTLKKTSKTISSIELNKLKRFVGYSKGEWWEYRQSKLVTAVNKPPPN